MGSTPLLAGEVIVVNCDPPEVVVEGGIGVEIGEKGETPASLVPGSDLGGCAAVGLAYNRSA